MRSGCRRLDRGGSKPKQLNRRVDAATGFPCPGEQIERRPRLFDPVGTEQRHLELVVTDARCDHVRT